MFLMNVPTRALFGYGTLEKLHEEVLPGKKALIVISGGKATKANGYLARVEKELDKAGVVHCLLDEIEANPLDTTVMRGAAAARANDCDFILALGGGSVMDASKAIAAMAANEGELWDYIQSGTGGRKALAVHPLPLVCVTTTAGTGSETDCGAVISNLKTKEKPGFVDPALFPVLAIIDPELMLSVPPIFTAFQGFDALFHSTECCISNKANLMSDIFAFTAVENVAKNLAACVKEGGNREAREKVAFANYLSGFSMMTGSCTSEHSLEHALSAFHHELPHGAGLIMLARAYYTHFIKKGCCPERFIKMARIMGMAEADKPEDFVTMLDKLMKACGVAELKMSDYGITRAEFPEMARNARETMGFLFSCDPAVLTDKDSISIYEASYK